MAREQSINLSDARETPRAKLGKLSSASRSACVRARSECKQRHRHKINFMMCTRKASSLSVRRRRRRARWRNARVHSREATNLLCPSTLRFHPSVFISTRLACIEHSPAFVYGMRGGGVLHIKIRWTGASMRDIWPTDWQHCCMWAGKSKSPWYWYWKERPCTASLRFVLPRRQFYKILEKRMAFFARRRNRRRLMGKSREHSRDPFTINTERAVNEFEWKKS